MSGTDIGYAATRSECYGSAADGDAESGTTPSRVLHTCYAMSDTHIAYVGIGLRSHMPCPVLA
eukprot:2573899-Rhodomonas_salina.4